MLPILDKPKFTCVLPSNKQQVKFVPFTVKQEKILLMALESKSMPTIIDSIIDIIKQCVISENVDIDKLPHFDIEYLMLQIRSKSVGEVINVGLRHRNQTSCSHVTKLNVNISDITIDQSEIKDGIFDINQQYKMKFNYPCIRDIIDLNNNNENGSDVANLFELIARCLQCVFNDDNVWDDFDIKQAHDFIMQLSKQQFEQIVEFITQRPQLQANISYTCEKCKQEEAFVVRGIENFFTL